MKIKQMKKWFQSKRNRVIFTISLIVICLFVFFPMPYEILLPGGVNVIEEKIEIDHAYGSEGTFHSTYVTVITKPSPLVFLFMNAFKDAEVVPMSDTEKQLSVKELNQYSRLSKLYSLDASIIAGYKAAEKDITYEIDGIVLAYRFPDFPIFHDLQLGDVITEIDGVTIDSIDDLATYMDAVNDCSQSVTLTLSRDGEEITITSVSKELEIDGETKCRLGIYGYPNFENIVATPAYEIKDNAGYGSSAGFMQALMVYNKLTEDDISYGQEIAGTGGITIDGHVTVIAGIRQKVMGAIEADMEIFFAPNIENSDGLNLYEIAVEQKELMNDDIIIVPVVTLDDAIDYLKNTYGN